MNIRKIIAPIIVTILLIAYFLLFMLGIINVPEAQWMKVIGVIIGFVFIGISIYNLIQRVKEIMGGEYDDLSKY